MRADCRFPSSVPSLTASVPIPGIDTVLVEMRVDEGPLGVGRIFAFGQRRVEDAVDVANAVLFLLSDGLST
jgi:hypothetical protein